MTPVADGGFFDDEHLQHWNGAEGNLTLSQGFSDLVSRHMPKLLASSFVSLPQSLHTSLQLADPADLPLTRSACAWQAGASSLPPSPFAAAQKQHLNIVCTSCSGAGAASACDSTSSMFFFSSTAGTDTQLFPSQWHFSSAEAERSIAQA